ncbi:hypothetical protein LBMAG52_23800 [Planctomycetia bacterium]|nr:hypothetical protein LBMAG52_23800 [Planctomycetia bacterium]
MFVLAVISAPLAAWKFLPDFLHREAAPNVLTAEVTIGPFLNRVLEQGEIESSSSIEVRCEVRSRNASGTSILEIVPEGTRVKAGDFLVKLDDSALQTELIQQQITCSGSEALAIEAEAAFRSAELTLNEYEEGTFREQQETLESALVVADENQRRAEEYLAYSQKLAERGYVSQVQLDADRFAVKKALIELGVATTKLEVLKKFSKLKMLTLLKADIQTDRAKLDARQKTWQLDKQRLKEIEGQIAKCIIHATAAGQVVYANDANRGKTTGELLIAEGMPVRERQILIRLPDPTRMRVMAKVHESRISLVRKGLTAEVTTDALPDQPLTGIVAVVSEYPIPSGNIYTSHIKEYAVEIEIHNPPEELRPGMSAQVDVLVEKQDSQLQIPIDAAIARGDKFFVAIPHEDGTFETREIKVGSANDAIITIREGLEVGQKVILNHSEIKDRLNLPELKLTVPPPVEPVATKPDAAKTDTANVKPVIGNAAKKS